VDVWDFNPEENVTDKIKKINEVKDGRGLRKFIKESLSEIFFFIAKAQFVGIFFSFQERIILFFSRTF
jgi:hypothetical protein